VLLLLQSKQRQGCSKRETQTKFKVFRAERQLKRMIDKNTAEIEQLIDVLRGGLSVSYSVLHEAATNSLGIDQ
jgi:hypothetical protein